MQVGLSGYIWEALGNQFCFGGSTFSLAAASEYWSNGNTAVLPCTTVVIPGALLSCFFRETIRVDTQAPQIHKENRNPFPFPKSFWMKPKQKAITVYLHGSFQILPAATHLRDVPKSDAMPRPCYDRCLQWSYRCQWKELCFFCPWNSTCINYHEIY